jgi:L-gulonate 3-dehydrogenase
MRHSAWSPKLCLDGGCGRRNLQRHRTALGLHGAFETIDLNASGGVRDYVNRYEGLYQTLAESQSVPVRWSGELLDRLEAERRRLPRADLAERQKWRDRRLMALAIHMAEADKEIGS